MTFVQKYIFPTDHKYIGKQYLLTGMFMALIGAITAILLLSKTHDRALSKLHH